MLRISKTDAMLGINTIPTKVKVVQTLADFEMTQKHPKVIIKSEQVKVLIDQTECFNEAGLKNSTALMEEISQRSKEAVAEGISRIVSEGNTLAGIESRTNAIADIAASNSIKTIDFNIDFIPKSRPKFEVVGGTVDITVDEGSVTIMSRANKPEIDVEVGRVEFFLEQSPEIHFSYEGEKFDKKV